MVTKEEKIKETREEFEKIKEFLSKDFYEKIKPFEQERKNLFNLFTPLYYKIEDEKWPEDNNKGINDLEEFEKEKKIKLKILEEIFSIITERRNKMVHPCAIENGMLITSIKRKYDEIEKNIVNE